MTFLHRPDGEPRPQLGFVVHKSLRADWTEHGVDVNQIKPDGLVPEWNARMRGEGHPELELKPGDRLMEVNKSPIKTGDDLRREVASGDGANVDVVVHRRLNGTLAVGGLYRVECALEADGLDAGEQVTVLEISSTKALMRKTATASDAAVAVLPSDFWKLRILAPPPPGIEGANGEQRVAQAERKRLDLEGRVSSLRGAEGWSNGVPSQRGGTLTLLERLSAEQAAFKKLEEEVQRLETLRRRG